MAIAATARHSAPEGFPMPVLRPRERWVSPNAWPGGVRRLACLKCDEDFRQYIETPADVPGVLRCAGRRGGRPRTRTILDVSGRRRVAGTVSRYVPPPPLTPATFRRSLAGRREIAHEAIAVAG